MKETKVVKREHKKRFAIHIDNLVGGGAEKVMLTLAQGLCAEGHHVHLFLLNQSIGYDLSKQIPVHILYPEQRLSKISGRFQVRASAVKLESKVREIEQTHGQFDIHLANLDATTRVLSYTGLQNCYFIVHNSIRQELKREWKMGPVKYFNKRKQKQCLSDKHLISVSKGLEGEIRELSWIKPKSIRTIYNPCDKEHIIKQSQQHNPDIPDIPYLIHVGRFARQKRHDILFQALAHIPDIPLVLLCNKTNKLLKMAEKYGVLDRLILPGFQANPYNWIANAKLKVLSSDYEGLPTVLIEALVCGTPVVSTRCEFGPDEILTQDLSDYLSCVGDAKMLADKVNKALATDIVINDASILQEVELSKVVEHYLALACANSQKP